MKSKSRVPQTFLSFLSIITDLLRHKPSKIADNNFLSFRIIDAAKLNTFVILESTTHLIEAEAP